MATDKEQKDIEIIPPGETRNRERDAEWVRIDFGDASNPFKDMPIHKRILLGAASLAGLLAVGFIVFLIVASAVLIWIPLLLAIALITAVVVFLRGAFRRR